MIKISDDIYEIGLNNPHFSILRRSFRSYKNYLVFFLIGLIIVILVNGYDIYLLIMSISLLFLSFLYCIFLQRKILYRFRYHLSVDMIELLSIRISQPVSELMAKRNDVRIILKKNFTDRYPAWQIYFYYKDKLIISQRAVGDWTKEMFLEIEEIIKTPPIMNYKA